MKEHRLALVRALFNIMAVLGFAVALSEGEFVTALQPLGLGIVMYAASFELRGLRWFLWLGGLLIGPHHVLECHQGVLPFASLWWPNLMFPIVAFFLIDSFTEHAILTVWHVSVLCVGCMSSLPELCLTIGIFSIVSVAAHSVDVFDRLVWLAMTMLETKQPFNHAMQVLLSKGR